MKRSVNCGRPGGFIAARTIGLAGALVAGLGGVVAHAQPAPAVYHWSWNPADALVRVEAQVFVDESTCSNICYANTLNGPWPSPRCAPPNPPPNYWNWSILPPVPPPAPPVPPRVPPVDWDEYPPQPPPLELGTIFVGDYCPCPTSDPQGNPPPLPPVECGLDWMQRVQFHAPLGLTFHNMLGHPSLMPEMQLTNSVFASDGTAPHATVPCFNGGPPGLEVTGQAEQVVTVRGWRGLIGTVGHYGVRTWEARFNNDVLNYAVLPPGSDRFVTESCATIVTQIPVEITGLTPGFPAKFTFEFQTLGETDNQKEFHPFLDPLYNLFIRPDSDNAYGMAMVDMYENGIWSTQFVEYVGSPPGVPPVSSPHGGEGGATYLFTPTQSTYPIVLRLTGRCRTYLEDNKHSSPLDLALASMKLNVFLTVFGPPVAGEMERVPGGVGPAYDFWMSKYEITNVEFADFLNDAEEDASIPGGGTAKSDFMVFDPTTGSVATPSGVVLFDPIMSTAAGGGSIKKIRYRPLLSAGTRYVVDTGAEPDAVVGVSWVGALKYCNWLTLEKGYSLSQRCYTEGNALADWHPVTISDADWVVRDLNNAERADLVANYRGYRLPMDNLGLPLGYIGNQANTYNEWYKASAYDPSAPNVARTGPGGETVPPLHRFYGFGRDTIGNPDANYSASGDPFDDGVAHAGFFDGVNLLTNGTSTNDTSNPFGFYDLSGNVDEWGQDQGPGFQLGHLTFPGQITRTGSWRNSDVQLAASFRQQAGPTQTSATIGFRVVTTFEPPTAPMPCPGDVDGDRIVGLGDLTLVLAAFGSQAGDPWYNPNADFDQDGDVDLSDLTFLLSHFGGPPCP